MERKKRKKEEKLQHSRTFPAYIRLQLSCNPKSDGRGWNGAEGMCQIRRSSI